MHRGREATRSPLPWRVVGAAAALVVTAACGNATSEPVAVSAPSSEVATATGRDLGDPDTTMTTAQAPTTAAPLANPVDPAPLAVGGDAAPPTTSADLDPEATQSLEGFGSNPRSAAAVGDGIALLRAVRVGRHAGFERIVFEFQGRTQPDYRVRWIEGPVTADGSGEVVDVEGAAHLEVILSPASGVDLTDGAIIYDGPDRVAVAGKTVLVRDLVRTGDFEAVLTWAIGASEGAPFRVLTLQGPTRVVVDLRSPSDTNDRS